MNPIGVFELMSGKTVLSAYTYIDNEGQPPLYRMEKPLLLQVFRNPNGQQGIMMGELPGLGPVCDIFEYAIAGCNLHNVDANLVQNYIKLTTGLQLATPQDISNLVS
jgi:hypothetical protein